MVFFAKLFIDFSLLCGISGCWTVCLGSKRRQRFNWRKLTRPSVLFFVVISILLAGMLVFSVQIYRYSIDMELKSEQKDFARQAADAELVLRSSFQRLVTSKGHCHRPAHPKPRFLC
jgi:hypothetical protein